MTDEIRHYTSDDYENYSKIERNGRQSLPGETIGDKGRAHLPTVVVLGAGFAGLWAARTLAEGSVNVILIDRNNYHTFFPLLYQVGAAELLMTHKRIESWVYWITVGVIGIWLYYVKEVRFISLLYVILLVMAMNGLITWHKTAKRSEELAHQPGY